MYVHYLVMYAYTAAVSGGCNDKPGISSVHFPCILCEFGVQAIARVLYIKP
jgi:hypothetical protein